ncbi:MAG: hypothetical protein R2789_04665 [Microthrixaceae bacterium]
MLDSGVQHLLGADLIDAGLVLAPFTAGSIGWTFDLAPVLLAVDAETDRSVTPATGDLRRLESVGSDGYW